MVRSVAIVTGGAGFIGSHMVDLLIEEGFEVRVIDNLVGGREENIKHHSNDSLVFEQRDIRTIAPDDSLFKAAKYVFHFGGIGDIVPSIENPLYYMSTNVQGTAHILECARHAGVKKFVYSASSSAMDSPRSRPAKLIALTPSIPMPCPNIRVSKHAFTGTKSIICR